MAVFYCHTCGRWVVADEHLQCSLCHSEFVEEMGTEAIRAGWTIATRRGDVDQEDEDEDETPSQRVRNLQQLVVVVHGLANVMDMLQQIRAANEDNDDDEDIFPLSQDDLARLPMVEVDKEKDGTQCSICMENFAKEEQVGRLDCQHIFHRACIVTWLEKHSKCPICRQAVDPEKWTEG